MPRSKHSDEIEFGSDSFLDVVANIVGILIILIVVAGIKAGSAPVSADRVSEFLQKHAAVLSPPKPADEPKRAAPKAPAAPKVIPASPELVHRADAIRSELADLDQASKTSATRLQQASHVEDETRKRVAALSAAVEQESGRLDSEKRKLADAESRLRSQKAGLVQLEVDVQSAEKDKPQVKTIKHKLTPLSRIIEGKEIHFRLLNDRVVYLPISELMERMRPEITRRRDRLVRDGIDHGQLGPVGGFRMDFILRVHRLSVVEELRHGASFTIGVSDWRLVPEPDLETESAEQALAEGSNFLRMLRSTDPDTTITLWVYPDSYALYQRLQEFAHQQNMTVAARPLPFGVPIAGSPTGSRSSGQ